MNEEVTQEEINEKSKKKLNKFSSFYEWIEAIVYAFVAVFIIFTFFFRIIGVDGDSMLNTLQDGNWLILSNWNYKPEPKDIVVITQPNPRHEPIIKRVIGVSGDKVNIDFTSGVVYINDQPLDEPYTKEPTYLKYDMEFPLVVPEGQVFVLGDNRNNSWDSRSTGIGLIDNRYLMGKAVLRIFPFGKWKID